jgi:hypothetical protein
MHLTFDKFDGRSFNVVPVIDEDTGNKVGNIRSDGVGPYSAGGITVSLFDDKYRLVTGRYDVCLGFVKGVEAVLNRMTSIDDGRRRLERELDQAKERLSTLRA